MTTPKEALEFYADPKNWKGGSILDMEASHFDGWTKAQQALASLQGEDAVERVAQESRYRLVNYLERLPTERFLIGGDTVDIVRPQYLLASDRDEIAHILATGLVPDEAAVRANERPLGDVFNELVRRMNFDGMDPRTFTLGELERAIDGAEFPK